MQSRNVSSAIPVGLPPSEARASVNRIPRRPRSDPGEVGAPAPMASLSGRPQPAWLRLLSLAVGGGLFLVAVPGALLWVGVYLEPFLPFSWSPWAVAFSVAVCLPAGLAWLLWSVLVQWRVGQGTPALTAPTIRLVTCGPYALCRNPIELGAVLYYLGLGALLISLNRGIICAAVAVVAGSAYHKLIEERELLERFGEEYVRYKHRTPFLIPDLLRLVSKDY